MRDHHVTRILCEIRSPCSGILHRRLRMKEQELSARSGCLPDVRYHLAQPRRARRKSTRDGFIRLPIEFVHDSAAPIRRNNDTRRRTKSISSALGERREISARFARSPFPSKNARPAPERQGCVGKASTAWKSRLSPWSCSAWRCLSLVSAASAVARCYYCCC